MAAGTTWADHGSYYYSPELSKKLRYEMQPIMRFRTFVSVKDAMGKNQGDTCNFDKITNISTQGGTLVETATMPEHGYTPYKGTLTINELGNAVPLTRKATELSQFELEDIIKKTLRNDAAKVIDTQIYDQFKLCKIKYVGTSSSAYAITTNGTATKTNTSVLNGYHLKNIVDYMRQTLKVIPWDDDGNYVCVAPTRVLREIHDELETSVALYTKYPFPGEVGSYYDVRFVRETNACDNDIGSLTTATGEAFIFGQDTVMEGIAVPEEILAKVPTDYGRSKGIAWYALLGYKLIWEGDPSNTIMHWTSA